MSERAMGDNLLVGPGGERLRPAKRCPKCGSEKRVDTGVATFGAKTPVINCVDCGHHFEGATT